MTIKQELFIKKYLEFGNGTQAALDVYNTNNSNVASSIAYENLRKPEIQRTVNAYFEREGLVPSSIAKAIKEVLDTGTPTDKLNALHLCLKLYGAQ